MDFSKINELKPYDLNCNIFDVYSYNGLSMQELLCQFFTKINECVKTSNETIDLAEWLVNEGLKQEVALKLAKWLNDGTLENIINVTLFENLNKKIDNVSSQLEHIENTKTVQDVKNMDLKLNTTVQTCGYYDVNDGGANTYIVIPSKEYSYDIECKTYAIRPVATSDTVCPKQFGTVNDGVNGDNIGIQACFDFVKDYNISTIDGRNLLYTTDSSTHTHHDHKGVLIHKGVTLKNYKGQLSDNATDLTSIIDIMQVDEGDYIIENCEFNGKYGIVQPNTVGKEDGGRHCICFYGKDTMFPLDYIPCGNITIRNTKFNKPDSYAIFMSPSDCIYTIENCTFDTNGPCILSYATTTIAKNCEATINSSYKGMVLNFMHDEMELRGNYQGSNIKSIYIDNCHTNGGLFKAHMSPQGKLSYDNVVIKNSTGNSVCEFYNDNFNTHIPIINYLELDKCKSLNTVYLKGIQINELLVNKFTNKSNCRIQIDNSKINNFYLNNHVFKNTTSVTPIECNINNFYLNNCKTEGTLDGYFLGIGCIENNYEHITNLYLNNFIHKSADRVIKACIRNIYIDNLHVCDVNEFDFIYNMNQNGCNRFILKNSVFECPTGTWSALLNNLSSSNGLAIIKDCVYTDRLNNVLNGMTLKEVNLINLNSM